MEPYKRAQMVSGPTIRKGITVKDDALSWGKNLTRMAP